MPVREFGEISDAPLERDICVLVEAIELAFSSRLVALAAFDPKRRQIADSDLGKAGLLDPVEFEPIAEEP